MIYKALFLAFLMAASTAAAAPQGDSTETALQRCLDNPNNASTAGQVDCEAKALTDYDRRLNVAYAALMRALPAKAGQQLRQSQRIWITFRDAERGAIGAIYATRQGTMYAPMRTSSATNITRDRTLQLEGYLRVVRIDG